MIGSMCLVHCVACDDIQYVVAGNRTFCRCERTSARRDGDRIVVAGPGRIVGPGGVHIDDTEIVHLSVAVGT
jgi:hypothetical protein